MSTMQLVVGLIVVTPSLAFMFMKFFWEHRFINKPNVYDEVTYDNKMPKGIWAIYAYYWKNTIPKKRTGIK